VTTTDPGTTTPVDPGEVAEDLRSIDRRLDALAELVGTPEAELGKGSLTLELDDLESMLGKIASRVAVLEGDDPFDTAQLAVAVRRERLGFVRAALLGGELTGSEAPALPVAVAADRTAKEGDRASSTGRALSVIGLVLVGFFLYQVTVTSLIHARSQDLLLEEFKVQAPLQAVDPTAAADPEASALDGVLTGGEAAGDPTLEEDVEPEVIPAAEPPAVGDPIGILQIPSLDVEQVVVQGSGPAQLRAGPGHLQGTPMPGEPGNAVIAGARISYGAPFRQLQELDVGDRIEMTTAVGRFRYEVRTVDRIAAGDPDPVRATGGTSTLTLLTSTPKFLAYDQLAVVADLQGQPVKPRFKPVASEVGADGFDGGGGLAPLVVWSSLLVAALAGARWIYRRWPGPVAYLISTPILLALLILVFESLGGILPATF
jgi:sortase A